MAGTDLRYEIPANIYTPGAELQNTKFWMLQENPTTLLEGLPWYDSVNHVPKYYDGTSVKEFGRVYTNGTGISISAQNVISVNLSATDIPSLASNKITAMTGYTIASSVAAIGTSDSLNTAIGKLEYHLNNLSTSDIPDLSGTYLLASLKGANNGVASLGADGKVPNSQLPGFVDDVIDSYIVSGATALSSGWLSLTDGGSALTPETGKIYVVLTTGTYLNKTYRWSGTTYVEISASPGNATESAAGIAEIATNSETSTGTDDTRIVTPKKLATYYQRKLTQGTGITINNNNVISVTDYDKLLKNTATGNSSLGILSTASSASYSTAVGKESFSGTGSTAIGYRATCTGTNSTAIGTNTSIGVSTKSAIQLGNGINTTSYSLFVGFYRDDLDPTTTSNWQLLDGTTGLIPDDRISSAIKSGASKGATSVQKYVVQNTAITVTNNVGSIAITHGLGTDDVGVTVIRNSDHKVIFPVWSSDSGVVTIDFIASANIPANTYTIIVMG